MKKLFLFALIAAFAAACSDVPVQDEMLEDDLTLKKGHKIEICHWDEEYEMWVPISVAGQAWKAHEAHGDKMQYSPEGSYTIYRPNGAELYVDIWPNYSDGYMVSGTGITGNGDDVEFVGATITVYGDDAFLLEIPQYETDTYETDTPKYRGTHEIGGDVTQCDGISNLYDNKDNMDYSLTSF